MVNNHIDKIMNKGLALSSTKSALSPCDLCSIDEDSFHEGTIETASQDHCDETPEGQGIVTTRLQSIIFWKIFWVTEEYYQVTSHLRSLNKINNFNVENC